MTVSVAESYRHCGRLARKAASNFYWSFWLLPKPKRQAMCALYAFSRHTDDLSDSDESLDVKRRLLARWRESLDGAFAGQIDAAIFPALVDTVQRFGLSREDLHDVINGVERDLTTSRYATFDDLCAYCYQVASVVGISCVRIWGARGDAVRQPAIKCGYAFQLTNILRDIKDDADRGRIYIPLEDLDRFQVTPDELLAGVSNHEFLELIRYEIQRTESLYDEAEVVADYLDADSQKAFGVMFSTYRNLLQEIKRSEAELLSKRVSLRTTKKLRIVAAHLMNSSARQSQRSHDVSKAPAS